MRHSFHIYVSLRPINLLKTPLIAQLVALVANNPGLIATRFSSAGLTSIY